MNKMTLACNPNISHYFSTQRPIVDIEKANLVHVSAIVLSLNEVANLERILQTGFQLPVFIAVNLNDTLPAHLLNQITGIVITEESAYLKNSELINNAATEYEEGLKTPFFSRLVNYVAQKNVAFDCPGHQGGEFFRRHPTGEQFYQYFGENIFKADLCNADVDMGDLLIHEGAPHDAQSFAAKVFNADKTYFVLNGTSSSNKVVLNALLAPNDLVLFDRNNHKSNHHGALIQAGATPIYLETARNPFGFIGGIDAHCFEEVYLREQIAEIAPERQNEKRPFRLAIIQLGTYDGTIYNAKQVVDKIGHLCDYILFDSAWVGYEQFIPMMKQCSPLLLTLNENDPGILVTQSVHKQLAGFSQTSQIHKKDAHIKQQLRYVNHKRMNNAFMMHASTSPFYPLFAALDVNAKIHSGKSGEAMWMTCVKQGIEARKTLLKQCQFIKPFIPERIDGVLWQEYDTNEIAQDKRFFNFIPNEHWHAFEGYANNQYFVDPCKLMLTTPGIDPHTGEYEDFGVPASVLANYLREHGVIPEKSDLNSLLFLLTPAETDEKYQHLISLIARFEKQLIEDTPLELVLPSLYRRYQERYQSYTLRQLCQEMHDICIKQNIKLLQKQMFRKSHFPKRALSPQQANIEFVRGNIELLPLHQLPGRIAAEGALPYPPGVLCAVPGEIWDGAVLRYFQALEITLNQLPGFSTELQGVYIYDNNEGKKQIYAYVVKE
ncbi:ornithine decarboxylase [Proteus myxofaciens]|uniref:ornithine decarboxylase n=1 Tax=Proteus myxofaciens ATCC 19692 TaxID=1354337 RepID=A0A198GBF9_9GAMM|nr:ornithine decarboxylase [Proteus myxofaciens]OAT34767.1 ornithine decarboxylase [Proteus myxofaciens ATCC 19692]